MKNNLAVLFLTCCLSACASKPVQKTECYAFPPETISAEKTDETLPPKQMEDLTAQTPSAVQPLEPVLPKSPQTQEPEKEECELETPTPPEEISPSKRIAALRQTQTLANPTPDAPSFENEETIPLEGRRLSPFAYEPVLPTAKGTAPWAGEELKYGLYYSFVKAGTAYIKTRGISEINGRETYVIQTTAFSAPVIDPFFKVRDVNYSWLDAENFYSLGYAQSVREGNYKRDEWLAFDYNTNAYYGELQKKEEPRVISGPLNEPVLDMLTSLYFVRAQELTPGKDIVFDIVNREKQYPLIVKVLKKEAVKTAAGKFNCIVVEPQFRGEGIFVSKGKSLQVWLTDDEYKMPVKMKTEVFIGSVSAELLEYKRN